MLAARVAAGHHTVTFRYLPRAFVAGLIVSLLATVGAIAFLLAERRTRRFGAGPSVVRMGACMALSPDGASADVAAGASLEESRRRLLDVVCRFGAYVAVPICAQQIWVNARVGRWDLVALCAVVAPGLVALNLLARKMSYERRAYALCALMGAAGDRRPGCSRATSSTAPRRT